MRIYVFTALLMFAWSCNNTPQLYRNLINPNETITLKSDSADAIQIIEDAPLLANGILEFDLTPLNSHGHFGALLRYQSDDSWVYFGCDKADDLFGRSIWFVTTPTDTVALMKDISKPYKGLKHRIKIRYNKDVITLWVDGEEVGCEELPSSASLASGKIGFRAWDGGAMEVTNVQYSTCSSLKPSNAPVEEMTISSPEMAVKMDGSFPRVLGYTWSENRAKLHGQPTAFNYITINGNDYQPVVTLGSITENSINYKLKIPELRLSLHILYEVVDNVLQMKITSIKEHGITKIRTIGFPENSMVSVANSQKEATFSISHVYHDFKVQDINRSNITHADKFFQLKDITTDNVHKTAGIAILNTHELSASIDNNVLQNLMQFRYKTYAAGNEKYTGVWCGDWIYRGFNGEITELPWAKVVVTDDVNNDKLVDWQDGAIALRSLMPELDGAEKLRSSFFHLGMLYGSLTQFTFLRWLDDLKKINLYTDGFGQIFQIKGYQSEGHDAAHPDYGNNFNLKAGGLEDLNTLFSSAQKYNTDICLHINHSESYPEAKNYDPEIVSDIPAWRWWDQSYFIIREKDILNGTFKQRIKQLHEKVPALKFVYIDTYREERWIADYTAKLFHEMGWAIWTEDNYALDRYTSWVHYAPGGKSKISRFVHHQNRDAFQYDSLLLGGPESRNYRMSDVNGLVYSCMTHQLPYRYLMHFPLMKWTDKVALFGDDVMSVIEDNQTVIKKSDRVIVRGRDVFIPWSPKGESKIYHYNTSGTKSVWELPQSWTGLTEVMLYELTDLGRIFTRKVAVKDGKVELRVKNKTPYVINKTKPDPMAPVEWGEGSLVKDMGFDSQGFGFWDKSANPASESQISIAKSENGNAHLHIAGGKAALVSQKLTGLQGGKTYSASVWAEVADGRKAVIGVMDYGAQEVTNFTDLGGVKNSINSQKRGDWHRLRVLFTVPEGKTGALLYLKAEQGNKGSFANFDDVRVMLYNRTLQKKHMFYEDFEHVDEGIYPFVPATDGTRVHLSEKHEGYTTDVLLDNFSLKISSNNRNGLMASTLPCNVRFQPNTKHTISFKYKVDLPDIYSVVVKSHRGGNKPVVMEEFLDTKGDFKHTITTGNHSDYYLAIYKHGKYSDSDLVIDNLSIDNR